MISQTSILPCYVGLIITIAWHQPFNTLKMIIAGRNLIGVKLDIFEFIAHLPVIYVLCKYTKHWEKQLQCN